MITRKQAMEILPKQPTSIMVDPSNLTTLFIGEPKFGKTRFFTSNPDSILLAFEDGHKFVSCKKIIIDMWDYKGKRAIKIDKHGCPHMTAMQAVEALEALPGRYKLGIVDTLDMAVKMAADFYCEQARKEHPSDLGDYGKGWDKAQNNPIRKFLLRLQKTGMGLGLITHTKTEVKRFTEGEKARKDSSLPSGVMKFAYAFADLIVHGEYGKKRPGNRLRDRILVCEGDEDVMAGNRTGALLPERYIIDRENQWQQFTNFFKHPKYAERAERAYRAAFKKGK